MKAVKGAAAFLGWPWPYPPYLARAGAGGCGDTMRDEEELESEVTVTRDSNPLSSVSEWKLLGDILLR